MRAEPTFLVTDVKRVRRWAAPNAYTDAHDSRQEAWNVHMIDGYFVGFTYDLYFESEAQADRYSPWQLIHPRELVEAAPPQAQFIAGDVFSTPYAAAPNTYTGARIRRQAWRVPFRGELTGLQGVELQMPVEREAQQFKRGSPYRLGDLFGTMPSAPLNLNHLLQQRADAARDAVRKAMDQRRSLNEAMNQLSRDIGVTQLAALLQHDFGASLFANAAAAAEKETAMDLAVGDLIEAAKDLARAAALEAKAAAQLALDQVARNDPSHPTQPVGAAGTAWWFITAGGATGWYDGIFYAAGTFASPANGWWFGLFSRDGQNPAAPGTYYW